MKVLCTTVEQLPPQFPPDTRVFTFNKSAKREGVGTIAKGWRGSIKRKGFAPSHACWDFVQLCLSVCAADLACLRASSADGWTRTIELSVAMSEPLRWEPWKAHVEHMLKVLTGDYWTLHFLDGGQPPPNGKPKAHDSDCVSLLSGGLDSLIGGIDLVAQGRRPMFVSQLAHEDSEKQIRYASALGRDAAHCQWSHKISFPGQRETSTRGRSLAFYAFAVLAASRIPGQRVEVFVPENGFICINPPLVPGRMGSLSTKTTHPLFIQQMQELLDGLGVPVEFKLPYRFKTKGEMLSECLNQTQLEQFAATTTSCGRYRTYNRRHCGRCVPCMIRRAAFLEWGGLSKDTTDYVHKNVKDSAKSSGPDDPMAAALAVLTAREKGLNYFLGASLAFAGASERQDYRRVLEIGLGELEVLLTEDGLL